MNPIKKPNRWSCSIASFAMALDVTVEQLVNIVGHDGSEEWFPSLPDPARRRGFHVQELVFASLILGYTVTPFEIFPATISPAGHIRAIEDNRRQTMFERLISVYRGVLTGGTRTTNHAMAFNGGTIVDPDQGQSFQFSFQDCEKRGFYAQCAWIITPIAKFQ